MKRAVRDKLMAPGRVLLRDHSVPERTSTPLELLFDLSMVVAVAFLASELHHDFAAGLQPWYAAGRYLALFVPIWWAWMSFTWFATAYDPDDAIHRILTLIQIAGVLAVASTIHLAIRGDLGPFSIAYTIMRTPLIVQWLRAARSDPRHRGFTVTSAVGTVLAQTFWLGGAFVGGTSMLGLFLLALAVELSTPMLAVHRSPDPVFHAGHIAERYGLFALIVLGETLLAVAIALQEAVETQRLQLSTVVIVASGLGVAFGMWWIYFDVLGRDGLKGNRQAAFFWGYGHFILYAAFAAIGAGVQSQVDLLAHEQHPGALAVIVVAVPVAASLAAVGLLQLAANRAKRQAIPLGGGAMASAVIGLTNQLWPTIATADLVIAIVVIATAIVTYVIGRRSNGKRHQGTAD